MSTQGAYQAGPATGNPPLNTCEWVKLYSDYLYNYAMYRVNNASEAEDLVQDTFLSALKAKDTFRGDCSEKTWLVTILKRKVIDFYRKKGTQGIQSSMDSQQLAAGYEHFFNEDGNLENNWSEAGKPQHWSESGYQGMETKEFYAMLNKCLSAMPEKWSALFCMKNMEDMDTGLICKELTISASNYWVMMHRAKLQLRKCIEINWFGIKK